MFRANQVVKREINSIWNVVIVSFINSDSSTSVRKQVFRIKYRAFDWLKTLFKILC